ERHAPIAFDLQDRLVGHGPSASFVAMIGVALRRSRLTPKPAMRALETPEPGAISRREARLRADTAVEIVLLRHGEPDWRHDGLSVLDAALTQRGRVQAEVAAAALGERAFNAIYVSPLRRAQETAEPLAKATGVQPITLDGLAEISIPLVGIAQPEVDA